MEKNNIILFKNGNMELEVNLYKDTVWLTQAQIAESNPREKEIIIDLVMNFLNT